MPSKKMLPFCFSASLLMFSIFVTFSNAFAQRGGPWGGHWGPGMMGGGFGGIVFVFMFIFWVLVIIGLVLLIRLLFQKTSTKTRIMAGSSNALEIIKERYARGEIEKDEFDEKKKSLAS